MPSENYNLESSMIPEPVVEAALQKASAVVGYAGSGLAIFGGLTANEVAALIGAAIAVAAFIVNTSVNLYYKNKQWKLYEKQVNRNRRVGDPPPAAPDFLEKM